MTLASCRIANCSLARFAKNEAPRSSFRRITRRHDHQRSSFIGLPSTQSDACLSSAKSQLSTHHQYQHRYFSSQPSPSTIDSSTKPFTSSKLSRRLGLITAGIGVTGFTFGMSGLWDASPTSSAAQCQSTSANQSRDHSDASPSSDDSTSQSDASSSIDDDSDCGNGAADFFVERNANQYQIFSGTSNPELAKEICSHLGLPLGRAKIGRFADGEVTLEILDEVRGKDVFVIQSAPSASANSSPHSSLMELFFMIAALKRASAKRVTAVLPYMSYFRQTTQTDQSKPLAAADMGLLLSTMGVDRVVFVDVHTRRAEGFFPPIPITNLQPQSLAIEYFRRKDDLSRSVVVVSTDNTGTEKAEAFMSRMQQAGFEAGMATLVSNRPERPQKEAGTLVMNQNVGVVCSGSPTKNETQKTEDWLVGDVEGKDCIIVDDIIDTGERAVNAAYALKSAGARRVYMFATHGLFSKNCLDRIVNCPGLRELVITDTIKIPENLYCEKLRVISVSLLLAEAIRRIHQKQPLSELHRDSRFDKKIVEVNYHQ